MALQNLAIQMSILGQNTLQRLSSPADGVAVVVGLGRGRVVVVVLRGYIQSNSKYL
jgi:hypothetical protein